MPQVNKRLIAQRLVLAAIGGVVLVLSLAVIVFVATGGAPACPGGANCTAVRSKSADAPATARATPSTRSTPSAFPSPSLSPSPSPSLSPSPMPSPPPTSTPPPVQPTAPPNPAPTAPPAPQSPPETTVAALVGAGDIASCAWERDEATATLLDGIDGAVFTAGDNVYPDGTSSEFSQCFEPSWGRHLSRMLPAPGNHDYHTAGASAYFGYFGAVAGGPGGYYAYDLGGWRIYALNSNCGEIGGCANGSAQQQWLASELIANARSCVAAYWHHPRFSSGYHGSHDFMQAIWQTLYSGGAEVVINGHDHNYERFTPMNGAGAADHAFGVREFVVGTGGADLRPFTAPLATSEARDSSTFGVLQLIMTAFGYSWQFVPVAGSAFSDSGSGTCHTPPGG